MFSAAEEILRYAQSEDNVDGTVEFECVGLRSGTVRFDEEGEEATVAGFGDDCI